jgi:hypothetical protein
MGAFMRNSFERSFQIQDGIAAALGVIAFAVTSLCIFALILI